MITFLLETFLELKKHSNIKFKLIIIGEGEERRKLEEFISENDLKQEVELIGCLSGDEIENYYRKSDIFILVSSWEGCPNALLEAMSYGLPVISTKIGGAIKIIEDEKSGFLADKGDKKKIIEKILLLAQSSELRNRIGFNAFQRIKAKYSMKRNTNELINIFKSVQ